MGVSALAFTQHQPVFRPPLLRPAAPPNALSLLQGNALPRLDPRTLVRIRLGDEAVRDAVVTEWQGVIGHEVRRYAVRGGPADELRSEALLALWEGLQQYDPSRHRSSPAQFVHNQIHRRVRQAYRRAVGFDRPDTVSLDFIALTPQPEPGYAAVEGSVDLEQAVLSLPPQEQSHVRQYLALSIGGVGPDDAARTLSEQDGTSFAAWKKRIARVRHKLRSALSD